jgi:hypothetical protein
LFLSGLPEGELVELQEDSTQHDSQHGGLLELRGVFKQLFHSLQTDIHKIQNFGFEFYGSGLRSDQAIKMIKFIS